MAGQAYNAQGYADQFCRSLQLRESEKERGGRGGGRVRERDGGG